MNATQRALEKLHQYGVFGYQPNLTGAAIFTAVYAICSILSASLAIKHKHWWILPTLSLAAALECAGNAIRIYCHFHPNAINPYIAQEFLLVITPAFIAATHFSILSNICILFGPEYLKPLNPNWLIPFFVTVDVASMAVQGGGSGAAAVAEIDNEAVSSINGKGYIIVAGLAIQLAGYLCFNGVFALFIYRIRKNPPTDAVVSSYWSDRTRFFLLATYVSALFILGRSVFRIIEMGLGWVGPVSTTEWYYLVFDATFFSLALIILIVVSPTSYMPRNVKEAKDEEANHKIEQDFDHLTQDHTEDVPENVSSPDSHSDAS